MNQNKSQSYFTTGGLPPISSSWRRVPWNSLPEFFFSQLNTCGHSPCTSSLTRGCVCHLQLLLAFASAFILGVRVPWDSLPYFTLSDWRLPSLSPATTQDYDGEHCCLSVDKETRSLPSRSPRIHISVETCVNFVATFWFSRVYNFHFSYPL
jgi:hypothetical protein